MEEGPYKLHPPKLRPGSHLLFDYDSNVDPRDVSLDLRTADCYANGRHVRARLSAIGVRWGGRHDQDGAAFIRLWLDERPLDLVFPVNGLKLHVGLDLMKQTVHACAERTEGQGPNKICTDKVFKLRPHDDVEFGLPSRLLGPSQDVVAIEAADHALCEHIGAYLGGASLPVGATKPTPSPSPKEWEPQSGQAFRFDVDNDGEIDDVIILAIDQYMLTGSMVAAFDADTVLAGKVTPPWWGDLMQVVVDNRVRKRGVLPTNLQGMHLQEVIDGGELGLLADTRIKFLIIDGKTYALVTPTALKSSYRPETFSENALLRAVEIARPETGYREILVRMLPGMKAGSACTFSRRSQIFE
jgi:hypothetical protein